MNAAFEDLYKEFLLETNEDVPVGMTERESVEEKYWKAKKHWEQWKGLIKKIVFESDAEEIDFFKNVKPLITSRIEYYVLLSEALLFVPGNRPTDSKEMVISFWKEQEKRCQRFFEKCKPMIEYYHSGNTKFDKMYFLRKNNSNDVSAFSPAPVHEEDNVYCTFADPIIRGYMAYVKYNAYVTTQLKLLQTSEAIK